MVISPATCVSDLRTALHPKALQRSFVQRQRWARGATQILFLPDGPLGPNLGLLHRLLFLPTHWLSQSCKTVLTVIIPLVFLLTGLTPLVNVTSESVLDYIVPMILALIGGIQVYAPSEYSPLASQVWQLSEFQNSANRFDHLNTAVWACFQRHA